MARNKLEKALLICYLGNDRQAIGNCADLIVEEIRYSFYRVVYLTSAGDGFKRIAKDVV